jgi:hypothetical protein
MDDATNGVSKSSFRVVFDHALAEQLENWRRRQPRIPTVAEGIRRVGARGIANDEHSSA